MEPDEAAWWSGWQTPQPGHDGTLTLDLPAPCTELLDLYLITSQAGDATATLAWSNVTAELNLTGDMTPSALEVVEVSTPIPAAQLAQAEVLTDLTGVNFPIYRPGPPLLLHPLADRLAVVRLPGLLPAGAAGLQCAVSLGHAQSHPVQFGLWARPAGSPAELPADPAQEVLFSGWTSCDAMAAPQPISFRLPRDAAGPCDIYLVTRLVDQPDAYFCHALWHDFAMIERDSGGPVLAAPAVIASPAPAQDLQLRVTYLVCSAPRTGSNLLSSGLRDTGVAGQPREYFLPDSHGMEYLAGAQPVDGTPLSLAARVPLLLQAGSQGGVFGATMHWVEQVRLVASLREAAETPDRPPLECLRAVFPGLRFIWLRRENLLAQAISHYVARQSDVWYVWEGDTPRAETSPPPVPFDFEAIQSMLQGAEFEEQGWCKLLAGQEADTLVLTYEELAAGYQGTLARVLGFLDIPVPEAGLPAPKLRRQADARNEELERLYLAESARRARQSRKKTA
jgi:LPS sulfotransferase NodH